MNFEVISEITDIEPIAVGNSIRDIRRLRRTYGKGRWRKLKGMAQIRLRSGRIRLAELHWYEAHGARPKRNQAQTIFGLIIMKQKKKPAHKFAVCVNNADYPVALELHKIYRVLPDADAAEDGDIRVIDESGEDYLYPAEYFVLVDLPQAVEKSLLQAA